MLHLPCVSWTDKEDHRSTHAPLRGTVRDMLQQLALDSPVHFSVQSRVTPGGP